MVGKRSKDVVMTIEADIVDTEATRVGLLMWRLLIVEAVALGTANMVTINDDEEVGTTLVTSVKLVDVGANC